ncbi:primosomal replication protein PriB/PriC domain protein [Pseudomonas sp. A-RE-19]|uniref:primosomal replication protein PriB/PriC domain protein n=1 Tax=Pseudomonas sp. A-RE-19 TaxID=2832401 RepID=UPI001CC04BBA|nr:primosomal replication protein PriB/PriC domain protein [Pseudomonas sp. A-RE-19]
MAALTPQEMLDKYMQAEADVLAGKDVQFNGRRVVMADLPQIRQGRAEWERRVAQAQRGGRPAYSLASFE